MQVGLYSSPQVTMGTQAQPHTTALESINQPQTFILKSKTITLIIFYMFIKNKQGGHREMERRELREIGMGAEP